MVHLLQIQLVVQLLDPSLLPLIFLPIVRIEYGPLIGRCPGERLVDKPRALIILNIRPDLPDRLWRPVRVQIIVLGLEVFAQRDQDLLRLREVLGRRELEVVQGQGDGEVEAVVGGLVDDDEGEFGEGEVGEVDVVFRRGD